MLHPKNNRIDYGGQLIPPNGYELDYAVGTTYTLDLEALMMIPVALFYAENLDGGPDDLRYDMLEAITKAASKIKVFYQKGHLKVPVKYHHLMAYWEKGIEAVKMPNHVSSFHPKVWVIRYVSKENKPKYRVLVTSRNLTFTRDWDMALATEGIVTTKEQSANLPLIHFLQELNKYGNKAIPPTFLKDLMKVEFDVPEKFESLKFIPIGIPNLKDSYKYANPLTTPSVKTEEMLIISPFLDKTTLDTLHRSVRTKPYLLSRKEELDGVPEETLANFDCWEFSSHFRDAEFYTELEDAGMLPKAQNLHAKLFVYRREKATYWYLGSANCSNPAQGRNVEFMVELKASASLDLKVKNLFSALTCPPKQDDIQLFKPYNFTERSLGDDLKNYDQQIRKIKYDLSKLPLIGKVNLIEGGTAYDLVLEIDARGLEMPEDFLIKVKPLPERQKSGVRITAGEVTTIDTFTGYAETALSIFLEFEISLGGESFSNFLLPMDIELPESRLDKIFTSIINSRDKFLKYLAFLLTGEETAVIEDTKFERKRGSTKEGGSDAFSGAPVFERLLIAASRHPEKLLSIDSLINKLKSESVDLEEPIITEEFESFWQVFHTFIKNK